MNISFKNRISFHYMVATAILIAIVFGVIFFVVRATVMNNLDADLSYEAEKHLGEIIIVGDSIQFYNKAEWEEREHTEIQVNPVFIQLIDVDGNMMDKSPNLKQDFLPFKKAKAGGHFNTQINNRAIRQVQVPIRENEKIRGYILAAISSESSISVIVKLKNVLLSSYFILLFCLYFISRFLAGRSIVPIQEITNTITRITKRNLQERVTLPQNKDEIYILSVSFNNLLDRIEKAIEREKQFTSDASHELRTPLSALRGTLEVLLRKPRTPEEYAEKIQVGLTEIDRMSDIIEQLLLLARLESIPVSVREKSTNLSTIIDEAISRFKIQITNKNLKINLSINDQEQGQIPYYYGNIIMENVLSNAIKYSNRDGAINISANVKEGRVICVVVDEGIGIKEEDLPYIFDNFFRSDSLLHKHISGNGLGLSLAKKCAEAIHAELNIESNIGQGTRVTLIFQNLEKH